MRLISMFVFAILVFAALNYSIYEKEEILANGDVVYLELAPLDPRSLIQGDYMSLRYKIERLDRFKELKDEHRKGFLVIKPDQNNEAQFVRFYDNKTLHEGEKLLRYYRQRGGLKIVPNSFLFQEGHAMRYNLAQYGVFKFSENLGDYLLTGLADQNRKIIQPKIQRKK